jgi:hypothetical protein
MEGIFIWNVPAGSLSSKSEKELKSAFASYPPPEKDYTILKNKTTHLAVDGILFSSESANFANAIVSFRDNKNKIVPSDGLAFILEKKNGLWEVSAYGDSNFCQKLESFPEDLIDKNAEIIYYGCPK